MKIAKGPFTTAKLEPTPNKMVPRFEKMPGGVAFVTATSSKFITSSGAHRLHRELEIALGL